MKLLRACSLPLAVASSLMRIRGVILTGCESLQEVFRFACLRPDFSCSGASYWGAWTPENNNFETDWGVMCTSYAISVIAQGHPLSNRFAQVVLGLWTSGKHDEGGSLSFACLSLSVSTTTDLFYSVTMPEARASSCPNQAPLRGGSGAESPGYTAHALASWLKEAPLLEVSCVLRPAVFVIREWAPSLCAILCSGTPAIKRLKILGFSLR